MPPLHKLMLWGGAPVKKKKINIEIGTHIRLAREAAGLTQEKLAELIPMAPKNVSDIERGVVGISLSALVRICNVLSVSSDAILFGDIEENEVDWIASRLKRLPPAQFRIASDMINAMFQAFGSAND